MDILGNEWSRIECKRIARSLMPSLFEPILYSAKSMKNSTFYDSSKEIYTFIEGEIEQPNGVLTPLLDCYTPLCVKHYSNGCYAVDCPNRGSLLLNISNKDLLLQRHFSQTSVISSVVSSQDTVK